MLAESAISNNPPSLQQFPICHVCFHIHYAFNPAPRVAARTREIIQVKPWSRPAPQQAPEKMIAVALGGRGGEGGEGGRRERGGGRRGGRARSRSSSWTRTKASGTAPGQCSLHLKAGPSLPRPLGRSPQLCLPGPQGPRACQAPRHGDHLHSKGEPSLLSRGSVCRMNGKTSGISGWVSDLEK